MKMLRKIAAIMILAALPVGCASLSARAPEQQAPPPEPTDVVAAPYDANALHNFYVGRQFVAQGRYELAREHYLLALASAREEAMRDTLVAELQNVDRLIKTLR